MDICIESHLFGDEIFPVFRKTPFFQTPCLHFMVPTLSPFLLSFPPLRKTEGEKQHEEVLPRFKITAYSEKHSFFWRATSFRQFSNRKGRDVCRRLNPVGVTKLCLHQFHCWFCDCFNLASLGSNPDNFKIWKCTSRGPFGSFQSKDSFESWRSKTCWAVWAPGRFPRAESPGGGWERRELWLTDLGAPTSRDTDLVVPMLWLPSISKTYKPPEIKMSILSCPAVLRLIVVLPTTGAGGRRGDQQRDGGAIRRNRSQQTAIWRLYKWIVCVSLILMWSYHL